MSHLVVAESSAEFSDCRRYRYALRRVFADGPAVLFVGLNPSTADESVDDPTIRRCLGFARRWGYGTLLMGNLYGWRSTDPLALANVDDPVGPENDYWLERLARNANRVVAAWGADPGPVRMRPVQALVVIGHCVALGLTKDGSPRHPLYMRADAEPVDFYPGSVS